ncbi:unnamed protein product [Pleuronectes platessa]|uniref:Uncharacterized protein n=1 Tax=Pleuronectes platessa TaxID=8262 RepID=A0A9N7TV80_PLEPL|nr:unnamed protein product [Pleuronectes platessa]
MVLDTLQHESKNPHRESKMGGTNNRRAQERFSSVLISTMGAELDLRLESQPDTLSLLPAGNSWALSHVQISVNILPTASGSTANDRLRQGRVREGEKPP